MARYNVGWRGIERCDRGVKKDKCGTSAGWLLNANGNKIDTRYGDAFVIKCIAGVALQECIDSWVRVVFVVSRSPFVFVCRLCPMRENIVHS